jgi:hypothetical protein
MIQSRDALKSSVRIWNCSWKRSGAIAGVAPIHSQTTMSMTSEKFDSSAYVKSLEFLLKKRIDTRATDRFGIVDPR